MSPEVQMWEGKDSKPLTAKLRARQARHREALGEEPGPIKGLDRSGNPRPSKHVVSMLPAELGPNGDRSDELVNFINDDVKRAVRERLGRRSSAERHWPGSIARDRLLRNMLASQPAAFNFFGNFVHRPQELLPWVRRIDEDANHVDEVRIEWAPAKEHHLNSGTAFDAWIGYRAGDETGFIAVEVKYAEDLAKADKKEYVEKYRDKVLELGCWNEDLYDELNKRGRQQFMLNVSLAQSLLSRGESPDGSSYQRGHSVVTACDEDEEARTVTAEVASCLKTSDQYVSLMWLPFGKGLELLGRTGPWVSQFRTRYLEDPR